MENKVKQFIYINPDNYISLEDLKVTLHNVVARFDVACDRRRGEIAVSRYCFGNLECGLSCFYRNSSKQKNEKDFSLALSRKRRSLGFAFLAVSFASLVHMLIR